MKLFPNYPTIRNKNFREIFQHNKYIKGLKKEKERIRFQSANSRYVYESKRCFFDIYFPKFPRKEFLNSSILEIGSFTGFSALSMLLALPIDGKLVALDRDKKIIDIAKSFFKKAEIEETLNFKFGKNRIFIIP